MIGSAIWVLEKRILRGHHKITLVKGVAAVLHRKYIRKVTALRFPF